MGCTLAQALEMGKSICPVCIGTDCIYINGIVWEPETGQLLISADTCTSVSCVDPISGAYIDVSPPWTPYPPVSTVGTRPCFPPLPPSPG